MKGLPFFFIIIALQCFEALRTDFYSIFAPKLSWNRLKDFLGSQLQSDSEVENDFSKTDIQESIEINISDGKESVDNTVLLQMLTRIFAGVDSSIEKYRRLLMKDGKLLFSFTNWPVGWRNYLFHVSLRHTTKSANQIWIHLTSITNSHLTVRVKLYDKKITLEYFYKALQISTQDTQQIIPFLNSFIKSRLKNEVEILQSRIRQRFSYVKDATIHSKSKQTAQLDRIINPDKYKSKSATVRRSTSATSAANTRYKPSSAAAARRVVRK